MSVSPVAAAQVAGLTVHEQLAGEPATYQRPGFDAFGLVVVPSSQQAEAASFENLTLRSSVLTLHVRASLIDFADGEGVREPAAGDMVVRGGLTYEVQLQPGGLAAFEPIDTGGVFLRLHLRRVGGDA